MSSARVEFIFILFWPMIRQVSLLLLVLLVAAAPGEKNNEVSAKVALVPTAVDLLNHACTRASISFFCVVLVWPLCVSS